MPADFDRRDVLRLAGVGAGVVFASGRALIFPGEVARGRSRRTRPAASTSCAMYSAAMDTKG